MLETTDSANASTSTPAPSKRIEVQSAHTTYTTCAYCGVGCGLTAEVDPCHRAVTIKADPHHPANQGRLCSKGASLGETLGLETRMLTPEAYGEKVSWNQALNTVSDTLQTIINQHGPDAVAFYGSGQLLTEDYYVANKLMKGFIGSANIDTNSRLCMSSSVSGHKRAFGSDTVPNRYEDVEQAELVMLIGSNTAWCHPVVFQRIQAAKEKNPSLKVVVIDPRRTETCTIADLHLPIASGYDVVLFNGLLAYLAEHNGIDHDYVETFTEGFNNALADATKESGSVQQVADQCRLDEEAVATFYDWFLKTPKTVSLYSQGVNQSSSGTDKVNAILNCHLATGRIGKPGAGPLSLTGQPNAMGGREVGGLANQLAAHMDFSDAADIDRVKRFWNTDRIADKPGYDAVSLFDAIHEGKVKAVWIMATNPVVSLPNADKVKTALEQCPFVVVSDCVSRNDTLSFADVKLPALGWSEKSGTVTNSERTLSRQRALLPPAGEAKPDWWIISQVAQRMGFEHAFKYQQPVEIFREHAALSGFENGSEGKRRDFDISAYANISLEAYNDFQPIQWPVNAEHPNGKHRFFSEGGFFTPNKKGQFIALTHRPPAHSPDQPYPLILNTGRLRDQWHTMTRSALSPRLNQHRPEPFVDVHPDDAKRYALQNGHIALLSSAWGEMYARVQVTDRQQQGNLFVPMHWTEQYASHGRMGALVNPAIDPISGQPESKHTPVTLRPFRAEWYGFILSRHPLSPLECAYRITIKGDGFYRYELAGMHPPEDTTQWLTTLPVSPPSSTSEDTPEEAPDWQTYHDPASGVFRAARFSARTADQEPDTSADTGTDTEADTEAGRCNRLDTVICIASTPDVEQLPERSWLSSLFAKPRLTAEERLSLLSGIPTLGTEDTGTTVCACFNVGEKTILKAIQSQGLTTHQEVGHYCKAGTNCGACVPEIKALLSSVEPC